jgi:uncharacterized protein (TIGR02147 family)
MIRSKVYQNLKPSVKTQFFYWSKWYNIVIREMAAFADFQEDPAWIASKLSPPITPEEAAESLEALISLGLLVRNNEGKLVQKDANISTGDEMVSTFVAQYHRELLQKAREAYDRFPREERHNSAITFRLSEAGFKKIHQMIHSFRKELLAVSEEEGSPDRVFQVNFQVFPLTEKIGKPHE